MGEVFIPLGGAGGKSRGCVATLDGNTPFANRGATLSLPLPAGTYKKSLTTPSTSYGDGKNAEVTLSKDLLKKMALNAFGIASITNFSLSMFAHKQVRLTWARPSQGLWSGVHFVFKYDSMPTGVTDGFMQVDSADVYYTTTALQERTLYVRAYNYVTTNEGRWYDSGNVSSTIQVTGVSGSVTFGAGAGLEKAKRFVGDAVDSVTSFVTRKAKKGLEVNSPSRVFKRIGYSVTEGLALGISTTTPDVLKTIDVLTSEMGKANPSVSYTVDTSNVKMNDDLSFMGVQNPTVTKQTEVAVGGFKEGMAEFYKEYLEPTMREMAVDVKRQANKKEETIVQIGNRTVHDVVTEQRNANGYSFVTER